MEKRICERIGCGESFRIREFSRKKYCSQRCRQILWALKEANKSMPKKAIPAKILLAFLLIVSLFSGNAFAGSTRSGNASWYSTEACRWNKDPKCPTANGESLYELERTKQDFAATWSYPMGSLLKITNIRNGKSVVCRIVDRGPAKRLGRAVDLSKDAFRKISDLKKGVIEVSIVRL